MTKTKAQKQRAQAATKVTVNVRKPKVNPPSQRKQQRGNSAPLQTKPTAAAMGAQISKKIEVVSSSRTKRFPGAICVRGQEFIQAVSQPDGAVGLNLVSQGINPVHFSGTRLAEYGKLYDKFLFTRLRFTFASAMATSAAGSYILAYDRDYADSTPPATNAGLQQYFSMMDSKISNSWESATINCTLADFQDFYYNNDTGYEGRIVFQGQIYMAAVTETAFSGSLILDYECEFFDPQLETADTQFIAAKDTTTSISINAGIFKDLDVQYGQGSVSESMKPWFWDDQDGERYVTVPPGSWALDFASTILTPATTITTLTLTAFRLDKSALADHIVDEVVNSLMRITHPVDYIDNSITGHGGSLRQRFLVDVPPNLGRIAILIAANWAWNSFQRTLSVVPISSGRLAIGDLAPQRKQRTDDYDRRKGSSSSSLARNCEASATTSKKGEEKISSDYSSATEFIDPGQVDLYKQFVRMQISK
jgi:hypothetical protein